MTGDVENPKQQAPEEDGNCGSGCCCRRTEPAGKGLWVLLAIVIVSGVAIAVWTGTQGNGDATHVPVAASMSAALPMAAGNTGGVITNSTVSRQMAENSAEVVIESLSELNGLAKDMNAVFLFVPGKDGSPTNSLEVMKAAKRTIDAQWDITTGVFRLRPGSRDYDDIAARMSVPGVLVLLKNGARCPIPGDISETNLVKGFLSAVSAGGCCPLGDPP